MKLKSMCLSILACVAIVSEPFSRDVVAAVPTKLTYEASSDSEKLAFDERLSIEDRWSHLVKVGKKTSVRSRAVLEKALKHKEWFMRNAALVVVHYQERSWAISWTKMMLDDPALVVRSAAVEAVNKLGAIELQADLWQKLNSSKNFRRGQSLWIRRQIVESLVKFSPKAGDPRFNSLTKDNDLVIQKIAMSQMSASSNKSKSSAQF
jgi:hypothetical protein